MKRSHAVVALALVVALCAALPAVGAAPNPLKVAKKALKIGKQANKRARKAVRTSNNALKTGRAADSRAREALRVLGGAVPNAAHATQATHAAQATHANSASRAQSAAVADALQGMSLLRFNQRVAPSATASPSSAARAAAQRVPLLTEGPITLYGKCYVDSTTPGNPFVQGAIFIETSVGGVLFSGYDGDSSNGFLEPTTPETERELLNTGSAAGVGDPGTLNTSDASAGPFYAIAPGISIQGQITAATKVGSPEAGDGVFGAGSGCIFAGVANAG